MVGVALVASGDVRRPADRDRISDTLCSRTLVYVVRQGPINLLSIRALGELDRVVNVDPRQHDDPVDDLIRALRGAADVTVRN